MSTSEVTYTIANPDRSKQKTFADSVNGMASALMPVDKLLYDDPAELMLVARSNGASDEELAGAQFVRVTVEYLDADAFERAVNGGVN